MREPPSEASGALSLLPSAQAAIDRVTDLAMLVAGATAFGLTALGLAASTEIRASTADVASICLPLVVWVGSYLLPDRRRRALVQILGIALLLTSGIWMPIPDADPAISWVSSTDLAFAIVLVAGLTQRRAVALGIVLATAAVSMAESEAIFPTGGALTHLLPPLGDRAGALYIVIVGIGLTLWRGRWGDFARTADGAFEQAEAQVSAARTASAAAEAQAAAYRRIHETTLNTLIAVAKGVRPESVSLLRDLCTESLRGQPAPSVQHSTLPELVEHAVVGRTTSPHLCIGSLPDVELHPTAAAALRDALVEAVRNAQRHADARTVDIAARLVGDRVLIEVRDDGIGIDSVATPGFGITGAMIAGLRAVGGTAEVLPAAPSGTVVRIDLPVASTSDLPTPMPLSDQATGLLSSRLMAISPLYYGILLAGPALALLPEPLPVSMALAAFALFVLGNAVWWKQRPGMALGFLTYVALGAAFVLAAIPQHLGSLPACAGGDVLTFLMDGGLGALIIVTISLARRPLVWVGGLAMTVCAAWATWTLAGPCRTETFMALIGSVTYLALVLAAVLSVFDAADARRKAILADWTLAERDRVRAIEAVEFTRTWQAMPEGTHLLLRGIADGRIDPLTLQTQELARAEATSLRAYLAAGVAQTSERLALARR